jgi:hypothetical protein
MLSQTLSLGILRQIRSVSEVPVLIVAVPFRPAHSRKGLKDDRLSDPEFLRLLYTQYQTVLRNLGSRMNFEPIWQDESTISEIGFTKSEFTLGAVTLDLLREGRERDDDLLHMNEHYGAIMLMNILRHLDAVAGNPNGREAGVLVDMLLPRHESFV